MPSNWPPAGIDWYYSDDWTAIAHGDCRELVPLLPPGSVDLVLTDPPYAADSTHAKHHGTLRLRKGEQARQALEFPGISQDALVALATSWVTLAKRWVIFSCEWRYMPALDAAGLLVRHGLWNKPNGAPQFSGDRPGTGWEALAICHRPGKKRWHGGGKHAVYTHCLEAKAPHPTAKPLALYTELLQDFSDPHECILDPFLGSGGTLRAAKDLGRRAIGIEIDERYCAIAARRLAQEVLPYGQRRAQCAHCQAVFQPERRTAQYCSDTCRKRAERKRKRHANGGVNGVVTGVA